MSRTKRVAPASRVLCVLWVDWERNRRLAQRQLIPDDQLQNAFLLMTYVRRMQTNMVRRGAPVGELEWWTRAN